MIYMLQSQLFTKVRREAPKDEVSKNAQLLIRGGFIYKEMAGVYALLPLGLRVVENIKRVIREEMNIIGSQELLMTGLQRKELWEETNRWDEKEVDVWFKSKLQNGVEVGFGWSHEEPITKMLIGSVESFRDLPIYAYQFQNKFRNELRAKSGIMRGREFLMKDLYSYSRTPAEHQKFYDMVINAYHRIFDRVGIGEDTFFTYADGGAFTKEFSHEFQTITDAGEDIVYLDRSNKVAYNEEVKNQNNAKILDIDFEKLEKVKTSEVGNIFSFGGKKCEELGLFFMDEDGFKKPVILGSYGIGVTRLMGVIAEKFSDDKGLVWPDEVAPFSVHIVSIGEDESVREASRNLYEQLGQEGIEVLWDDRDKRPGEKFAESDFLGIPWRVVVSQRSLKQGGFEVKRREEEESIITSQKQLLAKIL
jgi:prolyl-tRNA synthetase